MDNLHNIKCPLCKNFTSCAAMGISKEDVKNCGMFVLSTSPDASRKPYVEDPVNHPSHYTNGKVECIDAIEAALSSHTDPMDAWLTGQVIKYLWRWPMKNGKEDLEKAQFYLNRLSERQEGT